MLVWTFWISFLGSAAVALLPSHWKSEVRWLALLFAALGLALGLWGWGAYDVEVGGYQLGNGEGVPWIPELGVRFRLGADGFSLPLVILTGVIGVTGVLYSWNIEERVNQFFALYLLLLGGVYGVFLSVDLFLLVVFYEIAIVPKYFLIAIWGSTRKEYGAMKLVLYSFAGGALVLLGLAGIAFAADPAARSFDLERLAATNFSSGFQAWAFPAFFLGFGILAGLWPFHTWAPTGHVAAPTAASMLLAGVVMKLGSYGCLRVAIGLFPGALGATVLGVPGFWRWTITVLAAMNILYGAMVALVQRDFKFVIGYSSVSHMGFVLLGLVTLNLWGLSGALLQMFSHGIVAGLLFAVVGRLVYDRTHTRELDELGGLGRAAPFTASVFIIGGLASMGLPGMSGFFAELLVLIGSWKAFAWVLIPVGIGMIVTVVYTLRTIHLAFFGAAPLVGGDWRGLPPITLPEKAASCFLAAILFLVGLYPTVLLSMMDRASQQFLDRVKQTVPVHLARP
ncbi:MAG: NADH-quinone oxidoreductase subunit M [Verrucomicrobiae bacterium]|nr:NADH-quinone oxidoreductase subunit M [Verrucomicrobiae bacterium]